MPILIDKKELIEVLPSDPKRGPGINNSLQTKCQFLSEYGFVLLEHVFRLKITLVVTS